MVEGFFSWDLDRSAKAKFLSKGGDPKEFTYSFPYSIGSLKN
ncbi:MAG: hypothetical protein Ct9H300mP5_5290 [Candidatus Pelagibacterales bacterium]|nr:MAG: hypothetical protein Ct9H300mP5_5290 [Pelagibacterales bacterium]